MHHHHHHLSIISFASRSLFFLVQFLYLQILSPLPHSLQDGNYTSDSQIKGQPANGRRGDEVSDCDSDAQW